MYSILLDLPEICTVEDCLMMALKEINRKLNLKEKRYTLTEKPKLYELFIAKKNGKPKEDYPCTYFFKVFFIKINILNSL